MVIGGSALLSDRARPDPLDVLLSSSEGGSTFQSQPTAHWVDVVVHRSGEAGSRQETGSKALVALGVANESAFSEHKLNGECGKVGQP